MNKFDPTQIKPRINKVLTDSDMDGIVSAAIFCKVYPGCEVAFGDPSGVQEGRYNTQVDDETAVLDLPYVAGCGLYFDHHKSNEPKQNFPGYWAVTPSAARLIYEYYRESFNLSNFAPLIDAVDTYDSGAMRYQDVKNPNFVFKLAWITETTDQGFFHYLVKKLGEVTLAELAQDDKIVQRMKLLDDRIAKLANELPRYILSKGKITVIDLRKSNLLNMHISLIEAQLMDAEVVISIKGQRNIKFSLYQNNLLELPYEYNLLAVAKQLNPQYSGGHKKGCGFTLPHTMQVSECIQLVKDLINQQIIP